MNTLNLSNGKVLIYNSDFSGETSLVDANEDSVILTSEDMSVIAEAYAAGTQHLLALHKAEELIRNNELREKAIKAIVEEQKYTNVLLQRLIEEVGR